MIHAVPATLRHTGWSDPCRLSSQVRGTVTAKKTSAGRQAVAESVVAGGAT